MPRAASKLVPVVFRAGVKFSGDPSEQYTRVFALASASANMVNAVLTATAIFLGIGFLLAGRLVSYPDDGRSGARGSLRVPQWTTHDQPPADRSQRKPGDHRHAEFFAEQQPRHYRSARRHQIEQARHARGGAALDQQVKQGASTEG